MYKKKLILVFIIVVLISFSVFFSGFYLAYNIPNIMTSGIVTILILFLIILERPKNLVRSIKRSQIFIFLAVASWLTAEVLFGYYNGFLQEDAYPSFADLFYLLGYGLFMSYLVLMNNVYKVEFAMIISTVFTFSLVAFNVVYVSIYVFKVSDYTGSIYDLILLFVYPFVDLLIVLGSLFYYFKERAISINKVNTYWICVASFGVSFFIADLTFGYNDLFHIFDDYIFDFFFNTGYLLLGMAIIIRISYVTDPKRL